MVSKQTKPANMVSPVKHFCYFMHDVNRVLRLACDAHSYMGLRHSSTNDNRQESLMAYPLRHQL